MSSFAQKAYSTLHRHLIGLLSSKLAKTSVWLVVGGIAAGLLGYVFQVLMGRLLSPPEFGQFGAIMALYAVLAAPLGTLMMMVSRKVSEYRAKNDVGSISHFYYSVNIFTAVFGIVLLSACFTFSPMLQSYLKTPNITAIYLLGIILLLTFLPIINNAFLQGLQNFTFFSACGALGVLLKIFFSVALVWLGSGVNGALGGVALSFLAIWLISYGGLRSQLLAGRGKPFRTGHISVLSSLPVLIANIAFAAMTQLDMVLVNYYFSPHDAGMYAAASILGKAVMYLPGGVALALFPMVAENNARNKNSANLLIQALILAAVLCLSGSIFYYYFGEWLIRVLYGENYREAGEVLRYYGFAILPMTLVMVTEYFLIAKGRVVFAYLFMAVAPIQLLAVYYYHASLLSIVAIMAITGLVLSCVGFGLLWRAFRQS